MEMNVGRIVAASVFVFITRICANVTKIYSVVLHHHKQQQQPHKRCTRSFAFVHIVVFSMVPLNTHNFDQRNMRSILYTTKSIFEALPWQPTEEKNNAEALACFEHTICFGDFVPNRLAMCQTND